MEIVALLSVDVVDVDLTNDSDMVKVSNGQFPHQQLAWLFCIIRFKILRLIPSSRLLREGFCNPVKKYFAIQIPSFCVVKSAKLKSNLLVNMR